MREGRYRAPAPSRCSRGGDEGVALLLVLMAMFVIAALATVLVLLVVTEARIAGHYEAGGEALHAADAAIEIAIVDLAAAGEWNSALAGVAQSRFADGAPSGTRPLPRGGQLDLDAATNLVRCGHESACSESELVATTAERPWGGNNPRWQPYAYGPLGNALSGAGAGGAPYVIAWVGDDPAEDDGDPMVDGGDVDNPGRGIVVILAHAYGVGGVRRAIEAVIQRVDGPGVRRVRRLAWREVR